jgi:hypothetical protein
MTHPVAAVTLLFTLSLSGLAVAQPSAYCGLRAEALAEGSTDTAPKEAAPKEAAPKDSGKKAAPKAPPTGTGAQKK